MINLCWVHNHLVLISVLFEEKFSNFQIFNANHLPNPWKYRCPVAVDQKFRKLSFQPLCATKLFWVIADKVECKFAQMSPSSCNLDRPALHWFVGIV